MVTQLAVAADDVEYIEVHVGSEAPVQLELAPAGALPLLAGGEVQEVEGHGLLELVDAIPHEEQHGDVGLTHFCGCRRLVHRVERDTRAPPATEENVHRGDRPVPNGPGSTLRDPPSR